MRFHEARAFENEHRGGVGDAPWGGSARERDFSGGIGDHERSEIGIFPLRVQRGSYRERDEGNGSEGQDSD